MFVSLRRELSSKLLTSAFAGRTLSVARKLARPARFAFFGGLTMACGVAFSQVPVLVPGQTAVGAQAAPVNVTVTMTAAGSGAITTAVTSGAAGLDFALAPGSACDASATYAVGSQCTVSVLFTPKYPGLRTGAVLVTGSDGRLLGSTLVSAAATGALSVLNPGIITGVAGDGELLYRADGVPALSAPVYLPQGVVTDGAGNVYITDTNNYRIRRVDKQTGLISTITGNGTPGYAGDGSLAANAQINLPSGILIDGSGNIFFVDSGNNIVRRIDAVSGVITTVAGSPTRQGYSGDGGLATLARLASPRGLAVDAAGNLFIADTGNNVIRKVNAATGTITTVAGTGTPGFSGDGGGATAALLNYPWGVTIGPDGFLYIADLANNVVRKVNGAGIISTVAGTGYRSFSGDGGNATAARLDNPAAVFFNPAGDLYIADSGNDRIRRVSTGGIITTLVGAMHDPKVASNGDGGPSNLAFIYAPYSLYFDPAGNLFFSDMLHNEIREIAASPSLLKYDDIRVGKISKPQAQGLENDGNDSLVLQMPTLVNAALDPSTTTCTFLGPLAPDTLCNLGVEFAPTVIGDPVLGSVTLNSNAANSPAVVNLSGKVLSVNPVAITLTSNVNPSMVGTAVTFTATVASDDPNIGGPVTFFDGTTPLCSAVALSSFTATCTTSTLALGQHNITAGYAGDDNNEAKTSAVLIQTVQQSTTVALSASPNPAQVTVTVTLTATVTGATGTPTGTVVFYDGATALTGTITLNNGTATFATAQLTPGTHSLTVQYAGDTKDAGSTSNTVREVITQIATTTTLGSSNATAVVGTSVTFTASVASANGTAPTGTVQFSDGATVLGSAPLGTAGTATLTLASLAPGQHNIVATYSGDRNDAGSSSSPLLETIQQIPTATTLTADTATLSAGESIHLTAAVAINGTASADGPITGAVTFMDGTAVLGTAQLDANGQATLTAILPAGSQNLVAIYQGNTNYAGSTSNTLIEQVSNTATTTALSSSAPTSLAGKPLTFTARVGSATGVPTGSVTFLEGSTILGVSPLNQGVATFTTSSLPAGTHTITATYAGDTNYVTSKSGAVTEVVSLATTSLTLTGPAAVDVGTVVNLTGALTTNGVTPTGSLTLVDGTSAFLTQNVSATGSFTFATSSLSIGTHTLSVSYPGDTNNAGSVSPAITVVVQQATTATGLTSSANPSTLGQPLTLTASVSSSGAGISGTVAFLDGSTTLGSVSLANGKATFTTSSLAFGSHPLTAVYSGDTNHAGSTSVLLTQQVVQAASATLTSSVNPASSGTNVVFTANLAGVAGLVPSGSITFHDGANTLGVVALDASGSATFQSSTLPVGSHAISISYEGDKNFSGATASLTETIQNANTQIVLTASANPATYGTPLSLTATVTSNGGVATGPVTFLDGTATVGSATLNANGVATLSTSTLTPGVHAIVAKYAGDGKASGSVSTPLTITVLQNTTTVLAADANPALTLSPVVFTATVRGSVGKLTGAVTFTDGTAQLGVVQLDANGLASLTVKQFLAGSHSLTASYAGDASDFPSSGKLTETVQLRPTSISVTSSQTDIANPQKVTLISVVHYSGPVAATGTVTFTSGGTVVGTATVDATGIASFTVLLQGASESVMGTYNGDAAYAPSASDETEVKAGLATQFTMTLTPATMTVQSKQHTTGTLTVKSIQGFSDMLEFGCLGQPYASTCTFSKTQMQLDANGTGTIQMTLDTGNPLGGGALASMGGSGRMLLISLPLTLLMSFILWRTGRNRRKLPVLLLAMFSAILTFSVTGCAGLSSSGTPPGTYTFLVTASGKGSGATQSKTITLTVTQ